MEKQYKKGILFVHGIQGHPRKFNFIIRTLPGEIAYRSILLPGHGMNLHEFNKSDKEQWLKAVRREAEKMRTYCDEVYYVGHSMGCLLGLLTEANTDIRFSGMVLLCCPFYVKLSMRNVLSSAQTRLTDGLSRDPFVRAAWRANGTATGKMLEYALCAHPYMQLFELIHEVRSLQTRPKCKVKCFFSELDEVVNITSAEFAKKKFDFEIEIMPGCGHKFFTDGAKNSIRKSVFEMIGE